jgi:hypothetical protein
MARFQVASGEQINVLDFMQRPLHMAAGVSTNPNGANEIPQLRNGYSALAVCWPLMATSAIRRRHGDAPFIAEYIIPQLILQWITENNDSEIDGIAYSSVSCKTHAAYPAGIANFVFPAKEIGPTGHCSRLRRKFAMTESVAWHLLERVGLDSKKPFAADMELEFIPGNVTKYWDTDFGELEGNLCALSATVL